ncbi:MAG: histidine phosphatase family protein [Desulfomonilaceae bacterium]
MRRGVNFWMVWLIFLGSITFSFVSSVECEAGGQDQPQVGVFTTVFVLRHADRDKEGNLTEKGKSRAVDLVHTVGSAGIKGIYTTDVGRTKATVHSLAFCLGIKPEIYGNNFKELADSIMTKHRGETVLIVGHDTTVGPIIETLIGHKAERNIGVQFDDLHIVTIDSSKNGSVVSIKYGNQLQPTKCGR